jgi:hypothetical protein
MVLNARVTPMALSPDLVLLTILASIIEEFFASIVSLPSVVVTVLSDI